MGSSHSPADSTSSGSSPRVLELPRERAEPLPRAALVDPRTFHTFHREDAWYMYDVTTGQLLTITEHLATLLEAAAKLGPAGFQHFVASEHPDWLLSDCLAAIDALRNRGLLRHVPLDTAAQKAGIDTLWAHHPRRLQLLLAQMCNLKCRYCYEEANGSNARKRLMSFDVARAAVDYLVQKSAGRKDLQITFFGGEPLLNRPVLEKVVEYCEAISKTTDKRFTFELITNGTLLTRAVTDYLVQHRFLLMISLDGYREMNAYNRPSVSGHDYFDEILVNAKYAHAAYAKSGLGNPVKVRANLTHSYHDLISTVRFLESQGFTTIGIGTIENLPWSFGLDACTEADHDEVAAQTQSLIDLAVHKVQQQLPLSPYEAKLLRQSMEAINRSGAVRGLQCGVGRNTNIVDTDGKIYPCHRYGNMSSYVLGDIYSGLSRESVMSYYARVNTASSGKCQSCWARYLCSGPCAWEVSSPSGAVSEPREESCARIRAGLEAAFVRRERISRVAPAMAQAASGCSSCTCSKTQSSEEETHD